MISFQAGKATEYDTQRERNYDTNLLHLHLPTMQKDVMERMNDALQKNAHYM